MSNEEDSEMVFRAKMHFFASEVWTLEDQAEKLQLQVLVHTSGKRQFILELQK